MQYDGSQVINAPIERVWQFISDPKEAWTCAPGVEVIEGIDGENCKIRGSADFAGFRTTYEFDVKFSEKSFPTRGSLWAHGKVSEGGGTVMLISSIRLRPVDDSRTNLRWTATIAVEGFVAALGERVVGRVADQMTDKFFECVKARLEHIEGDLAGSPSH